jgi:hypothetical protein
VSSAILYLAIVAIWAFLLVPRWIRRSHTASFAGSSAAGGVTPAEPDEPEVEVDEPEADTAPLPAITAALVSASSESASSVSASSARPGSGGAQGSSGGQGTGGGQGASASRSRPAGPTRPPGRPRPAISRGKVLQARRRLLTILVLLAFAAASCTVLRLASPWVCIPPAVMLGMYVLLLRETALADAERAHREAQHAAAARQRAVARSRAAWAARTPQPTAQIIDISGRLQDQLYDQYEDATNRAVGD